MKHAIQQSSNPLDNLIYHIRNQDVMLDSDLAATYQVSTKAINQAVNRNQERFPEEFSFQLLQGEWDTLRSQIGTLNTGRGQHRKYLPRVFTEHGSIMLATVLNSARAIEASKDIVRAFVRLRHREPTTIDHILADPRHYAEMLSNLASERERRETLEAREAVFGNRTPYGEISKTNGLPKVLPVRGYLRPPRGIKVITTTEIQLKLFDWD